jgi:hypothetical protein
MEDKLLYLGINQKLLFQFCNKEALLIKQIEFHHHMQEVYQMKCKTSNNKYKKIIYCYKLSYQNMNQHLN